MMYFKDTRVQHVVMYHQEAMFWLAKGYRFFRSQGVWWMAIRKRLPSGGRSLVVVDPDALDDPVITVTPVVAYIDDRWLRRGSKQ